MPYQYISELNMTFDKDFLFLGIGMIAGKIQSDPNWRMWATILTLIGVLLAPTLTILTMMNSHVDKDYLAKELSSTLAPVLVRLENMKEFHLQGKRFTADDAEKAEKRVMARISEESLHLKNMLNNQARRILRVENSVFNTPANGAH
jgi:hypothetical protein